MKYLCLIHWDEKTLADLPARELDALHAEHLDYNDGLRKSGQFVAAEALEPAREATCVRVRGGKVAVTDGPFAETKEQVAGFYLIEARDLNEAIQVAATIPSARRATVEVRATRQLVVEGRQH
jgi:hypothetical protein